MRTLRDMRKAAHMTQTDIAAAVGVSQASVQQWEAGRATPTLSKLRPLCAVLGCELGTLVDALAGEPDAGRGFDGLRNDKGVGT